MKKTLSTLFLGLSLLLTSCATTIDAYYSAHADQFALKSVYLVNKSAASDEMDERIKKELMKRNIKVVIGPETKKVTTEDAIMKYNETWKTEITTNLETLDLILFDKNGELVASSHWKNSKVSTLATMSSIVSESVQIIFEKVQVR
jgi:hypothetical protein